MEAAQKDVDIVECKINILKYFNCRTMKILWKNCDSFWLNILFWNQNPLEGHFDKSLKILQNHKNIFTRSIQIASLLQQRRSQMSIYMLWPVCLTLLVSVEITKTVINRHDVDSKNLSNYDSHGLYDASTGFSIRFEYCRILQENFIIYFCQFTANDVCRHRM